MDKDTNPCENGVLTKSGYHIGYGHLVIGTACNMLTKPLLKIVVWHPYILEYHSVI